MSKQCEFCAGNVHEPESFIENPVNSRVSAIRKAMAMHVEHVDSGCVDYLRSVCLEELTGQTLLQRIKQKMNIEREVYIKELEKQLNEE